MNIESYLNFLIYALIYLAMAVVMKLILNFRAINHYAADQVIADGNLAVGLRRSGAQFGLAIAMVGVMSGASSDSMVNDLLLTTAYGLLAVVFMVLSLMITDRFVLPKIKNSEELKKGNVSVGFVEFGTLIMTGIIAYASIKGDDGGAVSSLIYFVAGQISVLVLVVAYERVFSNRLNVVESIHAGNESAGVYLAGKIIAYGLILQSAIVSNGAMQSLQTSAIEFVVAALSGIVILYIFEILIDKVIVTGTTVREIIEKNQIVAAVQLSIAKVGMSMFLGMAIL